MKYLLLAAVITVGCGSADQVDESESSVVGSNGIRTNGIRTNGIRTNGIRTNGIRTNGLEADVDFSTWFNEADGGDLDGHDNFMKYVVACALAANEVVTFTDSNSVMHTWTGSLGLAPGWVNGPISSEEEGWMSACLLAHLNSNGKTVQISVRGSNAGLATTTAEVGTLGSFAGAFFGDLFSEDGGYYACSTAELRNNSSQTHSMLQTMIREQGRECAIDGCNDTVTAVDCSTVCGGVPASSCTVDGHTFNQVINVYVPNYRAASGWQRSSSIMLPYDTTCSNCLNAQALDFYRNGSGTTAFATAASLAGSGGNLSVVVRYSNGTSGNLFLKVQVNNATVMNGSSEYFEFAPTGGWNTFSTRTVSFSASSAPTVKLVGGGSAKKGPRVDVAWIQFQ